MGRQRRVPIALTLTFVELTEMDPLHQDPVVSWRRCSWQGRRSQQAGQMLVCQEVAAVRLHLQRSQGLGWWQGQGRPMFWPHHRRCKSCQGQAVVAAVRLHLQQSQGVGWWQGQGHPMFWPHHRRCKSCWTLLVLARVLCVGQRSVCLRVFGGLPWFLGKQHGGLRHFARCPKISGSSSTAERVSVCVCTPSVTVCP